MRYNVDKGQLEFKKGGAIMGHKQKLMLLGGVAVVAAVCQWGFGHPGGAQLINTVAGGVIALSMLVEMIKKLRTGDYGVDLLAVTAIVATLAVGEYWAAMVILLMLIGGDTLEDYANAKAHSELKTLLDNSPRTGHVKVDGQLVDRPVEALTVGQEVVVRPGELVPVDGTVLEGESTVNESSLTGESKPLDKGVGDQLLSGSVNGDVTLTMRVERTAQDSQYQQLVELIKQADQTPADFVRLADRYALPFTLVSYLIAGIAWWIAQDPVRFAQVLVVASPCPLILAAPVAFVSGMSRASHAGIVVKTGAVIEKLATAKTAAFDKTGTLTKGNLAVSQVVPAAGQKASELLQLVASAEQTSGHVLAQSIVTKAKEAGLQLVEPTAMSEVTAKGIVATIAGREVKVGKLAFVTTDPAVQEVATTAVYVAVDGQYWGRIKLADQLRPEASTTLQRLQVAGVAHLMMVTGDRQAIAERIASEVGITEVYGDLLPKDKVAHLNDLPQDHRPSIMVGDGVNDAPVLKVADVGIAMGAHGSTAASESADVVILTDNLQKVAEAVSIAEDTLKIAKQAVWIGIAVCTGLMLICSTGWVPTIVGALLQEVVDTVCILWGLKAKRAGMLLE